MKYVTQCVSVDLIEEKARIVNSEQKGDLTAIRANIEQLRDQIREICNQFEKDGYDVISICPVLAGFEAHLPISSGRPGGYGYGFSVTEGVIVTGKKRN
jgi:hypothetical protein